MKSEKEAGRSKRTSRRQFARNVSAALLSAPLAAALAQAQAPSKPKEPAAPPNPPTTTGAQAAPPKPSPVAEAYAEVARARFSDHLTPEQMEQIRKDMEGNVRTAERLRAVKLKNEDEPDFIFGA